MVAESGAPRQARGAEAFRKERRLRRRADFVRAYEYGRKLPGRFVTIFALPDDGPGVRLGVTVTRRLGGAVERNRVRRRVREVFRRTPLLARPAGLRLVVNVHPRAAAIPFVELADELSRLLRRAAERQA